MIEVSDDDEEDIVSFEAGEHPVQFEVEEPPPDERPPSIPPGKCLQVFKIMICRIGG